MFSFFNHTHTLKTQRDSSPYSLTESRRADVFISLVFSVPSQLHRRGDECKSMPIDYPFSSHKNCLPQSPIHPFHIPSLHMDFSSQIVLCRDTPVARWARMCTVLLQFHDFFPPTSHSSPLPEAPEVVLKLESIMNE